MKAISLIQPWATLVAIGAKKIETRSWATKYRGELAIHASKNYPGKFKKLEQQEPFYSALRPGGVYAYPELYCGKIIAVVKLVDCVSITLDNIPPEPERSFGDYTPERYAWILEDVRLLPEPVPVRGRLGLWEWEP